MKILYNITRHIMWSCHLHALELAELITYWVINFPLLSSLPYTLHSLLKLSAEQGSLRSPSYHQFPSLTISLAQLQVCLKTSVLRPMLPAAKFRSSVICSTQSMPDVIRFHETQNNETCGFLDSVDRLQGNTCSACVGVVVSGGYIRPTVGLNAEHHELLPVDPIPSAMKVEVLWHAELERASIIVQNKFQRVIRRTLCGCQYSVVPTEVSFSDHYLKLL